MKTAMTHGVGSVADSKKRRSENRLQNTGRTRFKPGQSGNPGGRPKGLAALVREQTKDGTELVEIMLRIARGKLVVQESYFDKEGKEHTSERKPRHQDIISAVEWLADRGFGKPIQPMEHSGTVVAGLPDDYLQILREYGRKL